MSVRRRSAPSLTHWTASLLLHLAVPACLLSLVWATRPIPTQGPPVATVALVMKESSLVAHGGGGLPAVARHAGTVHPRLQPVQAQGKVDSRPLPPPSTAAPPDPAGEVPPLPTPPPQRAAIPASSQADSAIAARAPRPGRPGLGGDGISKGPQVVAAAPDAPHNRPPAYPTLALVQRQAGQVALLIHVATDGAATSVELARSSGYAMLDTAALDSLRHWHFIPARRNGRPVESVLPYTITFIPFGKASTWP